MLRVSCYLPPTRAIAFASLPPGPDHPIRTNTFDHSTGVLGRHLALYPASSVGRMDCSGSYHSHPGERCCHLRNAENIGEQESSKEEDS